MATNPTLLTQPIAANGAKNVIPNTTSTAGAMSQDQGFPAETSLPLGAGGVAPSREDFNGAFNLLSELLFYAQKGWQFEFDETQDYFAGCIVRDTLDGKLYEAINDVSASSTHPSNDSTNWQSFGEAPDLSNLANKDLSNLTQTGQDSFLERDFAIIYPNGGTAANPANVAVNSRYVEANPFAGYSVKCAAEVFYNNEWGEANFIGQFQSNSNRSGGVIATQLNDGSIVIQTGEWFILRDSAIQGNPFNQTTGPDATARPCRVKVWKIGKIPTE